MSNRRKIKPQNPMAKYDGKTVVACCRVRLGVTGGDRVLIAHDAHCPQGPEERVAAVRAVSAFLQSRGVQTTAWAMRTPTGEVVTGFATVTD